MSFPAGRCRGEQGFTLAEMVVALFVIAVASLTVLPNLRALSGKNRVVDAARQIQVAMQNARMKAINEERDHVFQFTGNGWNVFVDQNRNGVRDSAEGWLYGSPVTLPRGVKYLVPDGGGTSPSEPQLAVDGCKCARWSPSGTMRVAFTTTTASSVTVGNGADYRRVAISVAGAIRVQRWDAQRRVWE